MADEKPIEVKKGVVVEFDFAVVKGAEILYKATESLFKECEIPFSKRIEAQYLDGGNYVGAIDEYFKVVKTKKTAQKAAKDLAAKFVHELNKAVPGSVTDDFKEFVRRLVSHNVKVVVATRADLEIVGKACGDLLDEQNFSLLDETSAAYGCVKWDAWRRATTSNHLRSYITIAVPGSGYSTKAALLAGMGSVAVINPHVEYQDFTGANDVVEKLNVAAADKILALLKA